jgi:fatty acid desaturase
MQATEPDKPASAADAAVPAVEWPTVVLIISCYAAWLFMTSRYGHWPLWLVVPGVALLLTFHSSLQHEILHGHPTRSAAVNRWFGIVPLSLWIPYERYRRLHLVHHINDRLTDPIDDPESNYWTTAGWEALGPLQRRLIEWQATLAGRIVLGPWWRIPRFIAHEAQAAWRNEPGVRLAWFSHLAWCVPVVYWVTVVCGIPPWLYVAAMIMPGNGILLIRSFAEHRALPAVRERTAIVEGSWLLGPLFLFNNLHALHHEEPLLPWYRYNARYRATRERLLRENGGLVYRTYFDLARRYLFQRQDQLLHPTGRVASRVAREPAPAP